MKLNLKDKGLSWGSLWSPSERDYTPREDLDALVSGNKARRERNILVEACSKLPVHAAANLKAVASAFEEDDDHEGLLSRNPCRDLYAIAHEIEYIQKILLGFSGGSVQEPSPEGPVKSVRGE